MTNWTRRGILLALAWLLLTVPARAAFHLMMVVEVFPGYASNPNAQYVEIQMYFPGQNFVSGHSILVYDAANALIGTFTFPAIVPNGADQASILIATTQAETAFGVTADLIMTPVINASGGRLCFDGSGDCVAWGNYTGPAAGVGTPFSAGGLPFGAAVQRRLDRGTVGILDPPDDTDDSAADFQSAVPTPRNNAGVFGVSVGGEGYGSTPAAPGPIDFGQMIVVGFTVSANLLVQETGSGTLTVSNPLLGGTNPGDFSVTSSFPFSIIDDGPAQTVQLGCNPQAVGARTATLTLSTNDPFKPTVAYDLTCTGVVPPPSLTFYTVTPCRVVDTRSGGGPVVAGADRTFTIAGICGIPATATAVSLNVAVTQSTNPGNVRLYPAGVPVPLVSMINYVAGQTRANNAVVGLSAIGELTARCEPSGSTHLILDVNGYFQ